MVRHTFCGAVLVFKGKILLVKEERSKHWGLPRTIPWHGETEHQTAIRAIKSETGLTVELVPDFRHAAHFHYRAGSERIDNDTVYFLAEAPTDKIPRETESGTQCKWFIPHKILDANVFPEVIPTVEAALEKEI